MITSDINYNKESKYFSIQADKGVIHRIAFKVADGVIFINHEVP